ncbi:MAG: outer membrane protein [Ehrlichia sp.]
MMRVILYLWIIFLSLIYPVGNMAFAKSIKNNFLGDFYISGFYGYDKKVLEFKNGDRYLDFDFNANNVLGHSGGLMLGYICASASPSNFRTELEIMYVTKKKFINTENMSEELLEMRKLYWNTDSRYKVLFNLYYDIGNFFSIRDLALYLGSGINMQSFVNKLLKDSSLDNRIMMQAMVGIKYKLLPNVSVYSGYRYFINYILPKKDDVNFKYYRVLASSGFIFGLAFIF